MTIKQNLEKIRETHPLLAEELEEVIETHTEEGIMKFVDLACNIMAICYDLSQICDFGGNK